MAIEQLGLKTNSLPSEEEMQKKDKLLSEMKQYEVKDALVDDFLAKVDFKAMHDLFKKDFIKSSGSPDADFKIINRDRIVVLGKDGVDEFGATGSGFMYSPNSESIIINSPRLKQLLKDQPLNKTSILLQQLFHEEGHFVDAGYVREIGDQSAEGQAGLQKIIIINRRFSSKFGILNEAVNDLRASRLTLEYISATGFDLSRQDTDWMRDSYHVPQHDIEFFAAIHLFKEICYKISQATGVDEKSVADSFTHGAMHGLKLFEKGTRVELDLDSLFGKRFTTELAELKIGDSLIILDFMRKFKMDRYETKYKKYMNEFMAKYKK